MQFTNEYDQRETYHDNERSLLQRKNKQHFTQGGRYQALWRQNQELFTCSDPKNPQYSLLKARLMSYNNAWPSHINATPKQLAEAGFFYLGERDRCKCYYCNGGLQNWEHDDDPWFEHAKWFPQCEYVLQQCGPEYVTNINMRFPNLSRPSEQTAQVPHDIPPSTPCRSQSPAHNEEYPMSTTSVSAPDVYDIPPRGTSETFDEDCQECSIELQLVEQIKDYGFGIEVIEGIIDRKHEKGENFKTMSEMMEAAQEYDAELQTFGEQFANNTKMHPVENMEVDVTVPRLQNDCASSAGICVALKSSRTASTGHSELKDKLHDALETTNCVVCRKEERSCVFTSCGHFCCCNACGQSLHECPMCNVRIASAVRIYRM